MELNASFWRFSGCYQFSINLNMERIKINGKVKMIPSVSELTFRQFNDIIVKANALELKEYISVFLDIPVDELMRSNLTCASITSLHQKIFNRKLDEVIKDTKSTVTYENEIFMTNELALVTFGAEYYFELMTIKHHEKKINQYELCMYALAMALSKKSDYSDRDEIFKNLYDYNWTDIISQAFFLGKRTSKGRLKKLILSVSCIWELRAIRLKTAYSQRKLRRSERK